MADHPPEQVDREAVVVQTLRLWGDICTRENAEYLAKKVCAALDAATPRSQTITFDTEEQLHDHAERLNESGVSPDVAIMDARGTAALACRTAPGGDGWGFAYYLPGEDGFMHCTVDDCSNYEHPTDWKPKFPVVGLAGSVGERDQ